MDDYDNDNNNSASNLGVGIELSNHVDEMSNSGVGIESADKVDVPQGLDSSFGNAPYQSNGTIATNAEFYMLNVITVYSNIMDEIHSIPQYGFSKCITDFNQEGYNVIV